MKQKLLGVILILQILFISFPVLAINFTPEDTYNSVVIVYTNSGIGSGFCVKENLIITNAHVIGSYKTVAINLYDKSTIKGEVIKVDLENDMAVIQIEKSLTPLSFCSESKIGDEVYAIGAPRDMIYTMTKGIISALDRELGNNSYIQIDASVNSGNSGGPLINDSGQVLGMITLKVSNAEGIGFAIKAKDIENFINGIDIKQNKNETLDGDTGEQSNKVTENNTEFTKIMKENDVLKISVCILIVLDIVIFLLFLKYFFLSRNIKKEKDEYDFEIEIEE